MTRPAAIAAAVVLILGAALPARAAVTQREIAEVGVTSPPDARLPLDLPLQGEDGSTKPLRLWLGTAPSVWVLADYTCETLCGSVISIVSGALARSGLRPGADFRLIVVGLDPKDTAADAARMKQAQAGLSGESVYFLRGDAGAIGVLTEALGFRSAYDREHDQFAHPAAAFVVAPDGRLARALSGLAVDPATMRLAVVDAGKGGVGTLTDHIRLLCYGYDPAQGTYSVAIGRILAASAVVSIAVLALLIWLLLRREHAAGLLRADARRLTTPSQTPTTD
jgi:protein SCO1/2